MTRVPPTLYTSPTSPTVLSFAARLRGLGARLRPRLLTRVALALAAVGLLPVAIASFGLVDINRGAMEDQVLRTHLLAAQTAASRSASFLATRAALARGLAASAALADPRSTDAQELLRRDLGSFSDLGVLAIGIVNSAGEEVVVAQLTDPASKERARQAFSLPPVPALPAAGMTAVSAVPAASPPSSASTLRSPRAAAASAWPATGHRSPTSSLPTRSAIRPTW